MYTVFMRKLVWRAKMGYAFISYSTKNQESADAMRELFNKHNIDTWMAPYDIIAGCNYVEVINDAIKNCSCFLLILTEAAQQSEWIFRELERAVTYHKIIIPIQCENLVLKEDFEFYLSKNQILRIDNSVPDIDESKRILDCVNSLLRSERKISSEEKQELLYSQIIDLQQGDSVQFCEKICDLIQLLTEKLIIKKDDDYRLNILRQILNLYKMYWKNSLGYGNEYKQIAIRIIHTMSQVNNSINMNIVSQKKMLLAALAISLLHEDKCIRDDCIDSYTNGDVHGEQNSAYTERQSLYIPVLLCSEYDFEYSEEELNFICDIQKRVYTESPPELITPIQKSKTKEDTIDNYYHVIADYFAKGNNLFSTINSDEIANDFYNCLLLSYERLKNYCLEVGSKKTYGECVIRISELKQCMLHKNMQKSTPSVAERGIKALLGLTMPKSGNYDVFISYKHYDEDRAHRVYSFLQQNLKEVFFDKESLPELSKSDYEHAVMTALNHSKHFIVLVSKLELLESSDFIEGDWVRREMRTFNTEIQEGRKKDANFIILASDDVCDKVFAENKENIDIMWRWPEIIRFSEFETVLVKYIK